MRALSAPGNGILGGVRADTLGLGNGFGSGRNDVTGPSRHLLSNVAYTSRNAASSPEPEAALGATSRRLSGDAVRALAGIVLRRLDLLTALAAQETDKPAHRVGLPASGFHDLRQRCPFGALH